MKTLDTIITKLNFLPKRILQLIEKFARKIPPIQKNIKTQTEEIISQIEPSTKPYKNKFTSYTSLPNDGISKSTILNDIKEMSKLENSLWKEGYVSGAIYHGGNKHIDFLNQVYSIQSQSNPLHSDIFPSASKFESEIISLAKAIRSA